MVTSMLSTLTASSWWMMRYWRCAIHCSTAVTHSSTSESVRAGLSDWNSLLILSPSSLRRLYQTESSCAHYLVPPPFSRSMFNYYLALGFHQIPQNSELNKEIPVIHVLRIIVLSVVSVLCYHALYVYACILSLSFYCYSCSVIVIVHKCKKNCSLL